MKVFLAGARGRVAQYTIQYLMNNGHTVIAGSRPKPEEVTKDNNNFKTVPMDLHDDVETLTKIVTGVDAIYFTAGSRSKDLLQTDAFGAVKLMQAAENAGVKRFILLSSIFATQPEKWNDANLKNITDYNIAKFFADQWLINNTTLDYTIVQPGNLVEAVSGSGCISLDVQKSKPNTIPNVAKVLAEVLEMKNTYNQIIQMSDGDTPIMEALASI